MKGYHQIVFIRLKRRKRCVCCSKIVQSFIFASGGIRGQMFIQSG